MYRRGSVGSFLVLGAVSGVLSALGVIFIEKGFFIADEKLVAITPAVFLSIAIILGFMASKVSIGPVQLAVIPLSVYVTWYLAVQAAKYSADYVAVTLAFIIGGIIGAALLSLSLSTMAPILRKLSTIVPVGVVGAIGVIPFVLAGELNLSEYVGHFALFVCWQAAVLATIGHFLRGTSR